jgi:hypothetical protein
MPQRTEFVQGIGKCLVGADLFHVLPSQARQFYFAFDVDKAPGKLSSLHTKVELTMTARGLVFWVCTTRLIQSLGWGLSSTGMTSTARCCMSQRPSVEKSVWEGTWPKATWAVSGVSLAYTGDCTYVPPGDFLHHGPGVPRRKGTSSTLHFKTRSPARQCGL